MDGERLTKAAIQAARKILQTENEHFGNDELLFCFAIALSSSEISKNLECESSLPDCCEASANIVCSVSNPLQLKQDNAHQKELLESREQNRILSLMPELVAYLESQEHEGLAVARFIATKMAERPSISKSLESSRRIMETPWAHKDSRELFSRVIAEYLPDSIVKTQLSCENIDKMAHEIAFNEKLMKCEDAALFLVDIGSRRPVKFIVIAALVATLLRYMKSCERIQQEMIGKHAQRRESIYHILQALSMLVSLHNQEQYCHLFAHSELEDGKCKLHHIRSHCYSLWKQVLDHSLKDRSSYNVVICLKIWNIESLLKGGAFSHEIWTSLFTKNATSKQIYENQLIAGPVPLA